MLDWLSSFLLPFRSCQTHKRYTDTLSGVLCRAGGGEFAVFAAENGNEKKGRKYERILGQERKNKTTKRRKIDRLKLPHGRRVIVCGGCGCMCVSFAVRFNFRSLLTD